MKKGKKKNVCSYLNNSPIKDTWTNPKGGRIKCGKWGWLEWGGVMGVKGRQ